jgi:pentatricopeptide repeat protein
MCTRTGASFAGREPAFCVCVDATQQTHKGHFNGLTDGGLCAAALTPIAPAYTQPVYPPLSALMNVCIKCGQLQQALSVYRTMQAEGCTPNVSGVPSAHSAAAMRAWALAAASLPSPMTPARTCFGLGGGFSS